MMNPKREKIQILLAHSVDVIFRLQIPQKSLNLEPFYRTEDSELPHTQEKLQRDIFQIISIQQNVT